jgi:hypothetical protein
MSARIKAGAGYWFPDFAARVVMQCDTAFYAALMELTQVWLTHFRHLLDDMFDYLRTVRERPVWQPFPEEVKRRLAEPVPHQGRPAGEVYAQFQRDVLPYPPGNIHPRFWGWVIGTGTARGNSPFMLASA